MIGVLKGAVEAAERNELLHVKNEALLTTNVFLKSERLATRFVSRRGDGRYTYEVSLNQVLTRHFKFRESVIYKADHFPLQLIKRESRCKVSYYA